MVILCRILTKFPFYYTTGWWFFATSLKNIYFGIIIPNLWKNKKYKNCSNQTIYDPMLSNKQPSKNRTPPTSRTPRPLPAASAPSPGPDRPGQNRCRQPMEGGFPGKFEAFQEEKVGLQPEIWGKLKGHVFSFFKTMYRSRNLGYPRECVF